MNRAVGIRISDFGFGVVSGFGFRVSDFSWRILANVFRVCSRNSRGDEYMFQVPSSKFQETPSFKFASDLYFGTWNLELPIGQCLGTNRSKSKIVTFWRPFLPGNASILENRRGRQLRFANATGPGAPGFGRGRNADGGGWNPERGSASHADAAPTVDA